MRHIRIIYMFRILMVRTAHGCSTLYLLLLLQYLTPTPPSLRLSPFLPSFPPFSSPEPSNLSRELPATSLVIHDCALPEDFISFYAPHASCRGGGGFAMNIYEARIYPRLGAVDGLRGKLLAMNLNSKVWKHDIWIKQ